MGIIDSSKVLLDFAWSCANLPMLVKAAIKAVKLRDLIEKNKALEGCHAGERCFVLGNGPSLKFVDPALLKGEILFAVNMLYRSPLFEELSPSYYCAVDPGMFTSYRDELLEIVESNSRIRFIFSDCAVDGFASLPNVFIALTGVHATSSCHAFDLTKPCCSFINVVPFAIQCALYMGFKEIYLLGCDFNQFAFHVDSHIYEEADRKRTQPLLSDLLGHTIALMQHEHLNKYASREGVFVANATKNSLLDVYPSVELCDILNGAAKPLVDGSSSPIRHCK